MTLDEMVERCRNVWLAGPEAIDHCHHAFGGKGEEERTVLHVGNGPMGRNNLGLAVSLRNAWPLIDLLFSAAAEVVDEADWNEQCEPREDDLPQSVNIGRLSAVVKLLRNLPETPNVEEQAS